MARPYSEDLRARVVAACEAGEMKRSEIAAQYEVSERVLYNWMRRKRMTGGLAPKPHAGGRASRLDRALLRELVEQQNDATLEEYARAYEERAGRRYSVSMLSRMLKEMKLSRKGRRYVLRSSSSLRSLRSA